MHRGNGSRARFTPEISAYLLKNRSARNPSPRSETEGKDSRANSARAWNRRETMARARARSHGERRGGRKTRQRGNGRREGRRTEKRNQRERILKRLPQPEEIGSPGGVFDTGEKIGTSMNENNARRPGNRKTIERMRRRKPDGRGSREKGRARMVTRRRG